ncbi:metal ABC transporter substrate-binding protein [Paenibacillus glycanilyticus]|uniref:metal ABC transporter substrate-binding protein n=1 Tax=Paenibacillus glycanilyticus TaxID=126569 RepID=UPI00203FB7B9|nr:metal ABC transporter substrate-binding protein [Paenibacillus glycanilyticus]MCM3627322.1 metal ABC transporter substrate-binding protein [Paenibacillus glycanilyticus]
MRYMKSISLLLLAVTLLLSACGNNTNKTLVEGKTNVVTSFYPLYYLASQIGGDNVNVVNLIPAGVEPHDWTPKSKDLTIASKAQLFLYNGAGLEGWTDDFLKGLPKNNGLIAAEMSKGIELIHGNPEEEEEHAGEDHDHENDLDVDPHTWVSPKSAIIMAANVKDSLIQADAAHKDQFEANYKELVGKLEALNDEFESKLAAAPHKSIVVSHQAFGYLARDYGLKQIAITGLSPDAEPRAQDLLDVAKLVKSEGIKYIYFEELVSPDLAKTIASETDTKLLVLNPIEGLTPKQEKAGEDYVSLMEQNLQNLLTGLQEK